MAVTVVLHLALLCNKHTCCCYSHFSMTINLCHFSLKPVNTHVQKRFTENPIITLQIYTNNNNCWCAFKPYKTNCMTKTATLALKQTLTFSSILQFCMYVHTVVWRRFAFTTFFLFNFFSASPMSGASWLKLKTRTKLNEFIL